MIKVWTILAHQNPALIYSSWITVGFKLCDSCSLRRILCVEGFDVEGLNAHAAVLVAVKTDALGVITNVTNGCHRRMWVWELFPLLHHDVLAFGRALRPVRTLNAHSFLISIFFHFSL